MGLIATVARHTANGTLQHPKTGGRNYSCGTHAHRHVQGTIQISGGPRHSRPGCRVRVTLNESVVRKKAGDRNTGESDLGVWDTLVISHWSEAGQTLFTEQAPRYVPQKRRDWGLIPHRVRAPSGSERLAGPAVYAMRQKSGMMRLLLPVRDPVAEGYRGWTQACLDAEERRLGT